MPLYEYACDSCGHRFERLESMSASSEQDARECPVCGKASARRVPSVFGSAVSAGSSPQATSGG